ncbi:MAG TPA: AarF/ABC1/UbiB kinase family protein [Acidimicrobiales bacterium]|jgi:predicted unusual protein kinase regulating ubiquinone biosynthesis (AarF/ABC1/UbiB family)
MVMRQGADGDGIPTGQLKRSIPIVRLAVRTSGEEVLATLRRRPVPPETYVRRADRYVEVLGRSKGALMKAAQMMSIVPVLNNEDPGAQAAFQAALTRLQADAPPMAPELAVQVIEQDLGLSPERAFAEFDPEPMAAASIGQVHLARHHDGRALAVKVQYPGVAEAIRSDLRNTELMMVFMQLMRAVAPPLTRSNPKALAAEISTRIKEELDYRLEASNQAFFAEAYRGHPFIRVPEVVTELSGSMVLTQEYAAGVHWAEAMTADQSLRNDWGETIYRFAHGNLRRFGRYNADPHPGNYVFHLDGPVSFLDFGCVKRVDAGWITMIKEITRAAISQDGEALWRVLVEGGTFDAKSGLSSDELAEHFSARINLFTGPQPFAISPEMLAGMIDHEFSTRGHASKWVRSIKNSDAWIFYMRLELGVYGILAGLGSVNEGLAIAKEMDMSGPVLTPLGQANAAYWAART